MGGDFGRSGRTPTPAAMSLRCTAAVYSAAGQIQGASPKAVVCLLGHRVEEVGIRPEQVFVLDRLPPVGDSRPTNPVSTRVQDKSDWRESQAFSNRISATVISAEVS